MLRQIKADGRFPVLRPPPEYDEISESLLDRSNEDPVPEVFTPEDREGESFDFDTVDWPAYGFPPKGALRISLRRFGTLVVVECSDMVRFDRSSRAFQKYLLRPLPS